MNEKIREGLSFDDVLLDPRRSSIRSRYSSEIDLTGVVALSPNRSDPPITVHRPVISANMDTVTEEEMAATLAEEGGAGVIHRFMTNDNQVGQVRRVKEKMRVMEVDPPFVYESATISNVQEFLKERERGYVFVKKEEMPSGAYSGFATKRDFRAGHPEDKITEIMRAKDEILTVLFGASFQEAVFFMEQNRIEKVPVIDDQGKLKGVYTLHDYDLFQKYPHASLDARGRLIVGAAIGVQPMKQEVERALRLVEEGGVDFLVLDIAHGALDYTAEMLKKLKIIENIEVPIIAGNVANEEGVLYVWDSGADGVKVGVGPGWVCDTREVAGVGVPQITALMDAYQAMHGREGLFKFVDRIRNMMARRGKPIPIMGDGGLRKSADLIKALAAGASTYMVGSKFGGTDKSPGDLVIHQGVLYKEVRGMASAKAFEKRQQLGYSTTNKNEYVPEGNVQLTPFRGPGSTVKVLYELTGGARSGSSYLGGHDQEEIRQRARFIKITPAGAREQKRPLN